MKIASFTGNPTVRPTVRPTLRLIETDRWFGPLLTNFRLPKTDQRIELSADWPLLQVQLIAQEAYEARPIGVRLLEERVQGWDGDDWSNYYQTVVKPNTAPDRE